MRPALPERADSSRGMPLADSFATKGSIPLNELQPRVANPLPAIATVGGVKAADYWREVGAPKIRARKEALGRAVSNGSIAAAVEEASGKNTSRQLVEEWMKGYREPYVSQLAALCEVLDIGMEEVLAKSVGRRQMLRVGTVRQEPKKVRTSR